MRAALLVLAVASPALGQQTCGTTASAPGFAPGQAQLADRLTVGPTVELPLRAAGEVRLVSQRRPVPGSFAGAFPLEIKAAGTYRIALSAKVWIDVVRDGAPVESTGHEHGAPCSGVTKIVAFRLDAGRYTVQLSEGASRSVTAKVTREAALPAGK